MKKWSLALTIAVALFVAVSGCAQRSASHAAPQTSGQNAFSYCPVSATSGSKALPCPTPFPRL